MQGIREVRDTRKWQLTISDVEVVYRHVAGQRKSRKKEFVMVREQNKITIRTKKINRKNLPSVHATGMTKCSETNLLVKPVPIMMIPEKFTDRESEPRSAELRDSNKCCGHNQKEYTES